MPILYLRSTDGSDSDNGSTWALAKATLAGAFAAAVAGDTIYVSQAHSESTGSGLDLTSPGTIASPVYVICANDGAAPPTAVAATAVVATTAGNHIYLIGGAAYFYGVEFRSGEILQLGYTSGDWWLENCKLTMNEASPYRLGLGTDQPGYHVTTTLKNCILKFSHAGQGVVPLSGHSKIIGGSVDGGGTIPTNFFKASNPWLASVAIAGFDFSALGSNTLMPDMGAASIAALTLSNCKLGSGAIAATQAADHNIDAIRCDDSGTNYLHDRYQKTGSQVVETTIVRTGGATDGTTPISWKIVTAASATWAHPFESMPLTIWNDTTGSNVTVTVFGVWGSGAVPTNREIWMEVTYMGSSGSPIATINTANAAADYLASATNQASDSSTWGGSTTKFKMAATLSAPQPALTGPIYVTVKAAKPSDTFYVDPKIVLT